MPRRSLTHLDSERSARITSLDLSRPELFDVDVDRKKRIDDVIDYFGLRDLGADPCGESLLDGPGAS
jgi:hypothetical protein